MGIKSPHGGTYATPPVGADGTPRISDNRGDSRASASMVHESCENRLAFRHMARYTGPYDMDTATAARAYVRSED